MKQYKRYSYWLTKGGYIVNNRHGEDNPKSAGDIFLGAWYAHENTPYIRENGDITRDRYGKQVVLLAFGGYPTWVFSMVDEIDNKPRRI